MQFFVDKDKEIRRDSGAVQEKCHEGGEGGSALTGSKVKGAYTWE